VLRRLQAATLGEFEIKRELGRGGMAAVYLAHDLALDIKVALKVMAPGIMMGEGMIERFRLEAVTVAKLSHPNIVRVHALRQAAEDLHFIVMQYIPGRTVERVVRETGPLPIDVVRTVIGQVAHALAYAHRRGVVHRDVKPGNIMLDGTGDVVVTDFGIAKVATAPSHTLTGSVVGTPAYMSPEQCFAQPLTGASDQYSLGVVAFEMVTGQVPFSGPSYSVMHGHTHDEPPPIQSLRPDCPPDLEVAVRRMLAKTPEARFPSISEAATAVGARALGEHDPLRAELLRLAAVEESTLLDAMYPTPRSPVPHTRSSVARVARTEPVAPPTAAPPAATPPAQPPAPATPAPATHAPATPSPATPAAPMPLAGDISAARTVVDPALLTPSGGVTRSVQPPPTGSASRTPSRRLLIGAGAALLAVVVGAVAITQPWREGDPTEYHPVSPAPPTPLPPPGPAPTATVRIGSVPLAVTVGDTVMLAATVQGPDSLSPGPNEWRSSAPALLRIDSNGRAFALREGAVTIRLRRGALTDSIVLQVNRRTVITAPPPPVARLAITSPARTIRVGERVRLRVEEIDAAENRRPPSARVTWSSADVTVALVDPATGEVVARAPGRAVISARTPTGRATIALAVAAPPTVRVPDPASSKQDSVVAAPPPPAPDPEPVRERPPPTKSPAELRAELDETVHSYARAIEAEDLVRMRGLFPAMTRAQADGFRAFFDGARDIKLAIGRIDAHGPLAATVGAVARARVTYRIEYFNTSLRRSAREAAAWDATLERTATGWRMVAIR
jgi:serine/threonine protein kinase